MRGLLWKIFIGIILIQVLTRGGGLLLENMFNSIPPGPERDIREAVQLYGGLLADSYQRGGATALAETVRRFDRVGRASLILREAPAAGGCERLPPARQGPGGLHPAPSYAMALALPDGPPLCLVGVLKRPAPLPERWIWRFAPLFELLCSMVVSYFLARYLVRPIQDLRRAAAALAQGDMSARAGTELGRRRDETADLVREFDRMADRIGALIEAQQRFVSDVSHEIRSPLARLGMALALARREAGDLAAAQFDRAEREIDRMTHLVGELLTLSSLRGRFAPPRREPFDLAQLVRELAEDAAFERQDRAQDIRVDCIAGPVLVAGDADLLRRAAENVLRNALFYTPAGTGVDLGLALRAPDTAALTVRDRGPGVPEADLDRLFTPFYRVDRARARNTGGIGIGLAICERAVRLHGGTVEARNADPQGLLVTISLPIRTAARPARIAAGKSLPVDPA